MRNHLNWLFAFLLAIALIGCQDDINVNNPISSTDLSKSLDGKPVIETLTNDLNLTGSKILVAGVGTEESGAGTITMTIPSGVTILKAYLYWEGRHKNDPDGDPTIIVNGISVTGELIGTAAYLSPPPAASAFKSFAYRKDITNMGLVSVGTITLNVSGLSFDGGQHRSNGVGLLVVINDGTNAQIEVRDGADFAFDELDATDPIKERYTDLQTFTFPAASFDRVAELSMFVGDIEYNGTARPHYMEITVGGVKTRYNKPFTNNFGTDNRWETYVRPVNIPAGVTQVSVQLFSDPQFWPSPGGASNYPSSLVWVVAGFKVPTPSIKGKLGDKVWNDLDKDGIQDPNEVGVPNLPVGLYDCNGNFIDLTTTDANGIYYFENLDAGCYRVKFQTPVGWEFSMPDQGTDDGLDSDVLNPVNGPGGTFEGFTKQINLSPGQVDLTWDAGVYAKPIKSQLGDRVWIEKDKDCNGIQDPGELGLFGVTVELWNCTLTTLLQTTTTDANGYYLFTDLDAGCYKVVVQLPNGYKFSSQNQGVDDTKDSDVNQDGITANINLAAGTTNLDTDAGLCPVKSQLGDRVWVDNGGDCNGIQDPGELGLEGVTVELWNCALNSKLKTTTTDVNGNYLFTDLDPGCYKVKVLLPAGYSYSSQNQGGDDTKDSDVNQSGVTNDINLGTAVVDLTNDAGLCPQLGRLGDKVWKDMNCDGFQDDNEIGVPGVTVELYKCGIPTAFKTTTTDILGNYLFTDLPVGCYQVKFVLPTGYAFTTKDLFGNLLDTRDSDADPSTGYTANINLASGQEDRTWDAGLCPVTPLGKIGDKVWKDMNCDGFQDDNEIGVAGVTVELYKCGIPAVFKTTTTDILGNYLFVDLPEGCYQVKFVLPSGYAFTKKDLFGNLLDTRDSDADQTTGYTANINLSAAQDDRTWDAGLCPQELGKIGDRVWVEKDPNCNGIQDAGELGLAGVTVELWNCDLTTKIRTTTTDASGNYLFTELAAACYKVKVLLPSGYQFTSPNQGGDDTKDSDVNQDGTTANINLATGATDLTNDAGLCPVLEKAELGDYVWLDTNYDGIQNDGATGIPGLTVELYTSAGVFVKSTTTNALGNYYFKDLSPGDYKVKFIAPNGFAFTKKDQNGDDTKDSDADPSTGFTITTTLSPNEIDHSWDAGLVRLSTLGDLVWKDADCDGIQEAGEIGVSGVKVELYTCGSTSPLKSTFTDASGKYLFSELLPGCYYVKVITPTGYSFAPLNQGFDDTKDSDINPLTGSTANINLGAGVSDLTNDAGLCPPVPCAPCVGGVNEITIKQLIPGNVTFTNLNANDVVTANPPYYNIKNRLGERIGLSNDIGVYVNGTLNTMLHMSCSQPVDPGLVYGDFEITFARSKSGGPVCPPDCKFQEVGFKFDKDKILWQIKNAGQGDLVLKEIFISWPQSTNGQLEKIRLNGDAYVKLSSSPLTVGEDDWTGSNLKPRWIKPGDTKTLEFDFKNNVSKNGADYKITVTFYGTDCVLEYTPDGGGGGTDCTAKISQTLLKYTGPDRGVVTVKFQGKDGGLATYQNVNLTNGTILQTGDWTVNAAPGTLGTVMYIYINNVLHEAHHTSCSAPYVVGNPAPLDSNSPGNPSKGSPSPNWLIVDFRDADDL